MNIRLRAEPDVPTLLFLRLRLRLRLNKRQFFNTTLVHIDNAA